MSADIWIEKSACDKCGRSDDSDHYAQINITYNLSPMLREAGFPGWRALIGMSAQQAGHLLIAILDHMRQSDEHYRNMNPLNGWGDYDKCLQGRLRDFAHECLAAPDDSKIGGWL